MTRSVKSTNYGPANSVRTRNGDVHDENPKPYTLIYDIFSAFAFCLHKATLFRGYRLDKSSNSSIKRDGWIVLIPCTHGNCSICCCCLRPNDLPSQQQYSACTHGRTHERSDAWRSSSSCWGNETAAAAAADDAEDDDAWLASIGLRFDPAV